MKQPLKFSIQGLLSEDKEGRVSGPISPLLFAQEMMEQTGGKFNRLARVSFEDENIFQCKEDHGMTGHDVLIIGRQHRNDTWLSLWVDLGIGGVPVAMIFQSEGVVSLTPVYKQTSFERKLDEQELQQVFTYVLDHPQEIAIKPHV